MLFSATMTEDVEQLVRVSLRRPVRLAADTCDTAPAQLVQEIVRLKVRSRSVLARSKQSSAPRGAVPSSMSEGVEEWQP